MIIHGNKQISGIIYAREASDGGGAVALTNIIRGPQVVFGGLFPFSPWLRAAACKAILAAFGHDDGWQVIGATNRYLNGIAATDQTKAQALAALLNSSTTIAVNWGTMLVDYQPVEYLESTGGQKVLTGIYGPHKVDIDVLITSWTNVYSNKDAFFYGAYGSNGRRSYIIAYQGKIGLGVDTDFWDGDLTLNKWYKFSAVINNNGESCLYADGEKVITANKQNISTYEIGLFRVNGSDSTANARIRDFVDIRELNDDYIAKYHPCFRKSDNTMGMYDIIRGRFDANAGSGTFSKGANVIINTPSTP